ncbi:unnamed protein product [Symbiodinium natans]|uniref:Uncharacterized protein n=1 Tax=Symbiodinium natans TaxID=878477 RepID=A0A812PD23_9DINO|nr:unnamed protein product [Symbiodinium natans]
MSEVSAAPTGTAARSASKIAEPRSSDLEKGSTVKQADASCQLHFSFSDLRNCGISLHFFALGFAVGGLDAIFVNVLEGYLNVPSEIMKGGTNLATMPGIFTVFMGILSDARPVWGFRRRPYMAGGFLLSAACFTFMMCLGLPEPYFCFVDGRYQFDQPPCNPDAVNFYAPLTACLCLATLGSTIATAAAQGLVVEYAQAEPEDRRGRTQTLLHMVRLAGAFCATAVAAFGFNGRMFTGSFNQDYQLSYRQFIGIFAVVTSIAAVGSLFCVREGPAAPASIRAYCRSSWQLLESKAFCSVALFVFLAETLHGFSTSAGTWVGLEWAKTEDLQRQLSKVLGILLTVFGSWVAQKWLLNASWRKILFATVMIANVLDCIPQFLTIFDIVRNQYFYLGEPLTQNVPEAMTELVYIFMVNELADEGNTALVIGLVLTIKSLGQPLSVMISNQVFALFKPDLYLRINYVKDTPAFRWTVAASFLLTYCVSVLGLVILPLLPSQKQEAQKRKLEWSHRPVYAILSTVVPRLIVA